MTIEEAIRILTIQITGGPTPHPQDYIEAIQLGIEALKAFKDFRADDFTHLEELLPGETEK